MKDRVLEDPSRTWKGRDHDLTRSSEPEKTISYRSLDSGTHGPQRRRSGIFSSQDWVSVGTHGVTKFDTDEII